MPDRRSLTPPFIYVPVPPNLHRDPPLYFELRPERGPVVCYTFRSWDSDGLAVYEKDELPMWKPLPPLPNYDPVAP